MESLLRSFCRFPVLWRSVLTYSHTTIVTVFNIHYRWMMSIIYCCINVASPIVVPESSYSLHRLNLKNTIRPVSFPEDTVPSFVSFVDFEHSSDLDFLSLTALCPATGACRSLVTLNLSSHAAHAWPDCNRKPGFSIQFIPISSPFFTSDLIEYEQTH
jgi:hypothetical protein